MRRFFESQSYVNTVEDVCWVCLAPNRNAWKAPVKMVMCLVVV